MVLPASNELIPMTRRYPKLMGKVLRRDSKIVQGLINLWEAKTDSNVETVRSMLFEKYVKEAPHLSDERYWEVLRSIWIMCGSIERIDRFRELFTSKRKERYYFSTPEEAKRLRELEFPVRVFRAANDENDKGISWTLSLDYARKYKQTFNKENIFHADVARENIFALIERNKEEEVIIL